jgi:hypothetical protein
LYFKNINGIKNYNSWEIWEHACQTLYSQQVDIFGISESNIKWNAKLRSEASTKCHQRDSYHKVLIDTSSSDPTINTYQPGGTATIVTNKWTGRTTQPIQDSSGMAGWSGYKLQTNFYTYLIIITVFRPNIAEGLSTCYQQHISIMKRQGKTNPDPRQQLLDDLTNLIVDFNSKNHKTIVMIDANEGLYTPNSTMALFLANTQMTLLIQNSEKSPSNARMGVTMY